MKIFFHYCCLILGLKGAALTHDLMLCVAGESQVVVEDRRVKMSEWVISAIFALLVKIFESINNLTSFFDIHNTDHVYVNLNQELITADTFSI